MIKHPLLARLFVLLAVAMIFLSGCETAKTVDKWMTDADDWVREVAW